MATKVTHYCDGCGKKLEGERLKEAQDFTHLFNSRSGRKEQSIFCPDRCSSRAIDYWEESRAVALQALSTAAKVVDNHKRKFFISSLKEVV